MSRERRQRSGFKNSSTTSSRPSRHAKVARPASSPASRTGPTHLQGSYLEGARALLLILRVRTIAQPSPQPYYDGQTLSHAYSATKLTTRRLALLHPLRILNAAICW